jgi:hypothetical protein
VGVELVDGDGEPLALVASQDDGTWAAEVPPGLVRSVARTGPWQASSTGAAAEGAPQRILELDGVEPEVLVLPRSPGGNLVDRLQHAGVVHVHAAPADGEEAAALLSAPQGLFAYALLVVEDGFELAPVLGDADALSAVADFAAQGGGIFVEGGAASLIEALRPGDTNWAPGAEGVVPAVVVDAALAGSLGWEELWVPVAAGKPVARSSATGVPLLGAVVEVEGAGPVDAWLGLRWEEPGFHCRWFAAVAPPVRSSEWWRGDPEAWSQADGRWEGRAAVVDRLLFSL